LNLHVFVRQGPNANWTISGQTVVDDGSWAGTGTNGSEENGASYTISLDFDDREIQFILYTDRGNIFGTGMMESGSTVCSGTGGGTLSGPALGDLGDWRGEWISETFTTTREQTQNTPFPFALVCLGLTIAVVVVTAVIWFVRISAPYKPTTASKKGQSAKSKTSPSTIRRLDQGTRPDRAGARQPLAEYLVTYTADDRLFDLSFAINKSSQYVGEFGVAIAKELNSKSNQTTALEVWLFGTRSAQTISKILMSEFCNSQPSLRSEMERKGEAILIQPGLITTLETQGLIAKAQILEMEYEPNSPNPRSVFKKVVIKIEVRAAG
jgi:hypothetical protein